MWPKTHAGEMPGGLTLAALQEGIPDRGAPAQDPSPPAHPWTQRKWSDNSIFRRRKPLRHPCAQGAVPVRGQSVKLAEFTK